MEDAIDRRTNAAWLLFKLCMVMVFFLIAVQVGLHKGRMLERAELRMEGAVETAALGPMEKAGRFECAVCHGF